MKTYIMGAHQVSLSLVEKKKKKKKKNHALHMYLDLCSSHRQTMVVGLNFEPMKDI